MVRDYRLDNARILLNIFVVFGHFFGPAAGSLSSITVTSSVYLAHLIFTMPCLAFISGIFSRDELTGSKYYDMLEKFILPYVIFNTILYFIIKTFSSWGQSEHFFFDPNIQLWYLLSLVTWRMLLPLFTKIRFSLLVAFILGIGIGYVDTLGAVGNSLTDAVDFRKDTLSILRTFILFPFFLLGYYSKDFIRNIKSRFFVPSLFFVGLLIFCSYLNKDQNYILTQLAYGSFAFKYSGLEGLIAVFYRLFVYVLGIAGIFSFIYLTPKNNNFLSEHGKNSMYSYILHIFPVMLFYYVGFERLLPTTSILILTLVYLVISIVFALTLTSKFSVKLFKPLVEPSGRWCLKNAPKQSKGEIS
jgi:fucose 4-O-acetylase-like acetyltransferase